MGSTTIKTTPHLTLCFSPGTISKFWHWTVSCILTLHTCTLAHFGSTFWGHSSKLSARLWIYTYDALHRLLWKYPALPFNFPNTIARVYAWLKVHNLVMKGSGVEWLPGVTSVSTCWQPLLPSAKRGVTDPNNSHQICPRCMKNSGFFTHCSLQSDRNYDT